MRMHSVAVHNRSAPSVGLLHIEVEPLGHLQVLPTTLARQVVEIPDAQPAEVGCPGPAKLVGRQPRQSELQPDAPQHAQHRVRGERAAILVEEDGIERVYAGR